MAKPSDVVLEYIDRVAKAARRARHDPLDIEALHRFRIAVRRLIVSIKVVEKSCGVPAKLRKRLRWALRETGPRRDEHIMALWLQDYAKRSTSSDDDVVDRTKTFTRTSSPRSLKPRWWHKFDRIPRIVRHDHGRCGRPV
jgi:CHAD domain-containing protein